MEFTGKLVGLVKSWQKNEWTISFAVNEIEAVEAAGALEGLELCVKAEKKTKKRSANANRLFWECITKIAFSSHQDKWDVYMQKLKAHGKSYPTDIVKEGLEALKATWREIEVVGEWKDRYGKEWVSVLCYPGSSLYNTQEFASLLEDVIEDMKDLGLQPPTSQEMQRSLEQWEKLHQSSQTT